ncbi:4-(cytidine 5'-diphospho)-2-C-methyl-D-erythritol kinase [Nonomuraea glycinis]|uniref:4-diphosphocytidyl-2-C-methyl-D-erythritol kinase n=1 Tax=Nonomuraea glycinis TaxID=2047744 RepID=A0A918ABG9_9ACTN|nr:4-(cytidine 5'-diphospho)-2-C-methyl-D-erythritol kinase [Nonomuraea glycinis]MCA2180551.1 4-(cytidine 5'-diphospho)-2-C-methyl-D-erythritol kinase [Nonomuraea glycinis]GGP12203.1 4-diphosphocytidyl-2-C-methyl-D-erythritol kinase [Nonomuraea glycinis]
MSSVTVRVPAKVNVQLSVGPLREDGYHDLVNVFHAVSIFDDVVARESDSITVAVTGDWADLVPVDDTNLAVQAARALAKHAGVCYGADLVIHKAIPVAGGMAGGSADAAAALVACNELWGLRLPAEDLMRLAADLGSDVPFSLMGGTALGTGRGELLTELPTTGTFHWTFAMADGGLSTPSVYAECDRLRATPSRGFWPEADAGLLAALRDGDPHALGRCLSNDLQPAALSLRPALAVTLEAGRRLGALGAIVSGSGPTCAFLVEDAAHAARLAQALPERAPIRATATAHGPTPGATIL